MRPLRFAALLLLPLTLLAAAVAAAPAPITNPAGFVIHRGVNLSHWLSQCPRNFDRASFITERDITLIQQIGYDHVRLPVDEIELWTADGQRIEPAFQVLTTALDWCRRHGLRVIVDLHTVRSHHFNNEYGANTLWTKPESQEKFLQLWRDLSAVLKPYPVDFLAYEIMNEPVADNPEDWNALIAKARAAIRALEPRRVLVIGSNKWQQAATFPVLKVPAGDPNLILSVHDYEPFAFTHHEASWTHIKDYRGPVHYPGVTITPEELAANVDSKNTSLLNQLRHFTKPWDAARTQHELQPAIDRAKALHLQLYCGEFGTMPTVPRADRLAWYRDMVAVMERNGLAWANWEYRGEFGILSFDRQNPKSPGRPDDGLIAALLHRDGAQ